MVLAAVLLTACAKDAAEETGGTRRVRFNVEGDFASPVFSYGETRAGLSADGSEMTDLWLLDYMGGELVQTVHQTPSDTEWGSPSPDLTYGSHTVYFVASRGVTPVVDTDAGTIVWEKVRDTFWKAEQIDVTATTSQQRSVTLDRVVARLRLVVTDEVPAEAASMVVMPARWNYGLDYRTGEPCEERAEEISVAVPQSYIGTTDKLALSLYTFSGTEEWTTDVTVSSRDADNDILGRAVITAVPLKRNRATVYTGRLFTSGGGMDVSLNDTWEADYSGTW